MRQAPTEGLAPCAATQTPPGLSPARSPASTPAGAAAEASLPSPLQSRTPVHSAPAPGRSTPSQPLSGDGQPAYYSGGPLPPQQQQQQQHGQQQEQGQSMFGQDASPSRHPPPQQYMHYGGSPAPQHGGGFNGYAIAPPGMPLQQPPQQYLSPAHQQQPQAVYAPNGAQPPMKLAVCLVYRLGPGAPTAPVFLASMLNSGLQLH